MGTTARISKVEYEGSVQRVRSIYCNWDGYPNHVGRILKEHYDDPTKIDALLDLGDISCLGKHVNGSPNHSYKTPEKDVTIAYHRDRGEKQQPARIYGSLDDVPRESYNYVYTAGNWWLHTQKTVRELQNI
jgi:hypothetical protein